MKFIPEGWEDKAEKDSSWAVAVALMYCAEALDNMGLRMRAGPASGPGALEKVAMEHENLVAAINVLAMNLEKDK